MIGRVVRGSGRLRGVWIHLKRLHADQRGAEGLEKLLIIAVIVLPLLAVLIWSKNAVVEWFKNMWADIIGIDDTDTGDLDVPNP